MDFQFVILELPKKLVYKKDTNERNNVYFFNPRPVTRDY